jgi:starch synthase (maltosyl-transferring)
LRNLLASFFPDVVHAWGLPALRAAAAASGWSRHFRLTVSRPLPHGRDRLTAPDCWLLRRADHVVAGGADEARRLLALGLDPDRVSAVPPAVEESFPTPASTSEFSRHPFLLCLGRFEGWKGHRDALWAFDILYEVMPEYHLVLAGDGTEKPQLCGFLRGLGGRRNIHFLGAVADVSALMRQAELVWIPSRRAGGTQTALEALAAGTAVVATSVPELVEWLAPLGADVLVPPGDPPALARRTRSLLENLGRRRQLGERGRLLAQTAHNPEQLVRRYDALYHKRAG